MSTNRSHLEVADEPSARPRLEIRSPPSLPGHEGGSGALMNAIPMLGSLGGIVMVTMLGGSSGGDGVRHYVAAGLFLLATVGFVAVQVDRTRRQRTGDAVRSRRAYLRHLAAVRRSVRESAEQQQRTLLWHHPPPTALPSLAAEGSRLWERSASDPRFLHVRFGTGVQALTVELTVSEGNDDDEPDPVTDSALQRFLATHRSLPDQPTALDLRAFDRVQVCGDPEQARSVARAMLCSATAFNAPRDLAVAVLTDDRHLPEWDWLKWLPHAQSRHRRDATGPARLVATTSGALAGDLAPGADGPTPTHILLITDQCAADLPPTPRMTVVEVAPTVDPCAPRWLRLDLADVGVGGHAACPVVVRRPGERPLDATADLCGPGTAEALARRLARRSAGTAKAGDSGAPVDLLAATGATPLDGSTSAYPWQPRAGADLLRVPIGRDDTGRAVHLDLKESAQGGMGPHGLVIGATGSGKSELLRTLVLGLALTHAPTQLNLVLVDFKGGATFAGLADLPHTSAVITNLAQELDLVDRMQDSLVGEMVRRQELLRRTGNHASARDYEHARAAGADLAPLPSLLIVVDEFSEMLAAKPDLLDAFVALGRLGRSLGIHLVLASQRLEEGRLRGLDAHLSYRVALRTFSAQESRAVLGVPDAYELPAVPGLALLRSDPTTTTRFRAAHVSGPAPRPERPVEPRHAALRILPFSVAEVRPDRGPDPRDDPGPQDPPPAGTVRESLLTHVVRRLQGHGPAAHRVWLPPLRVAPPLDRLLTDLRVEPRLGLVSPSWRARGALVVPLGTVDLPAEQRRESLTVDLAGAAGNVAVVGGPRSGKSTLLRTLVAGLALTRTPQEVQVFAIDLGGGTLASVAGLPHLSGLATRAEPDVVRRVVAQVRGVLEGREAYFRSQRLDSIEDYRAALADGLSGDGYGDVFLVVDGWSSLHEEFEDLEADVHQIAARGLTYGVHVVLATSRWADLRSATRDLVGTRLELRLGDPLDSELDRRAAARVPTASPGRGLDADGRHFLAALPRIDADPDPTSLPAGGRDLVDRVCAGWAGPAAPELRLLPRRIDLARVREQAGADDDRRLLLGLDERDLAPIGLDPDADPHLLIFGDGGSGKSAALRSFLAEVRRTHTPQQAQVVLVDYRRSLLGEVPDDYLLEHVGTAARAASVLDDLATHLESRLPGPDVTPDQLRRRTWWTGAEVFVVVDDDDLVTSAQGGHGSPLVRLRGLLPIARDVGLHVVLARRAGGASRALHEPIIQALCDLAAPGLLLSGSPEEGPLVGGVRPTPAAPGRARLVTRDHGSQVLQLAWADPSAA